MPNQSKRDRRPIVKPTRRQLLSAMVAATSVAVLNPLRSASRPVSTQTRVATPGAKVPNTLAPDASPRFREVANALTAAMTATGTPGAALGILADGREEHATFGMDRIDGGVPVTRDTLFQIGSITKTFTATAVMHLVDEGALDLDATVRTYLPGFRLENEDVAARVTLRHLLTHTGGWWGDLFIDTGDGDDAIAEYVDRWMPTLPQHTPLGMYVNYNNAGFTLLGRLIEVATDQEFRAALQALVLDYELHPLPEQVRPALIADIPARIPVEFIAEDVALVTIGEVPIPIGFVRDEDGDIGWIAVSARLIPKVESA